MWAMATLTACTNTGGSAATTSAAATGSASASAGADEQQYKDALIKAHIEAHQLWNDRKLDAFIPTFASPIHYTDVPTGHAVSDATKMTEFAAKWYEAAPDAKLSGAYYYAGTLADQLGEYPASLDAALKPDLWTIGRLTLAGTQTGPLPEGKPPTNKPFSLELTEFIAWRQNPPSSESIVPPWQATGGAMYYDANSLAKQLGLTGETGLGSPVAG